jgi:hypothetical protein
VAFSSVSFHLLFLKSAICCLIVLFMVFSWAASVCSLVLCCAFLSLFRFLIKLMFSRSCIFCVLILIVSDCFCLVSSMALVYFLISAFRSVMLLMFILIFWSSVFLKLFQIVFLYEMIVFVVSPGGILSIVIWTGLWSEFNSWSVIALL